MTMNWKSFWMLFAAAAAVLLFSDCESTNASGGPSEGVYQVGVAKVDVTPSYPVRLNGFGFRRDESEGITHQIWVKALAIGADDEQPAILFMIDATGVRETMIDKVAARLKEKAGIQRDRIALTFTHSHTTPKLNGVCDTIFSSPIPPEHQAHLDQYDAEVTGALEKVALAALADRKPSRLEWAVGSVGFAANRRPGGGPVDHDLPVLIVRGADDGAIRAVYTTYACHCVTLSNNKVSGDWAGFAQQAIERTHPGAIALVSIGCGSDSNPSSGVTGDNTAAAADQGAQIADEVERLLQGKFHPITGALATTYEHIDVPLNPVPDREQLTAIAAKGGPEGYNAEFQLAKLDRGEPLQSELDYPIQTWAFGDSLAMVFLAGEVCVDYSLRLKEELDASHVWLHGYSNDFCAYIPSERLLREGGYGGGAEVVYFALPNTLAPGLEDKIISQVHRQIPPAFAGKGSKKVADVHPLPLEQALASIKVKPGFVVEVAASEPLIADPVAIDFGPDGRLWVADMTDYTHGVNDEFEQTGSVRALTDSDGDGHYDKGTVFASGLRFPTDVKAWDKGVIVCDAPDVIYLEDTNNDGKADVRKVLLTGFETHNAQARVNSLRWGLDNWLYGSCGLFGGKIKSFAGREFDLGGRDFRFHPDTGELEAVTGKTQQGRSRDDWGNWFGCENSTLLDHYPIDDHYLARNPRVAPPPAEVFVPTGGDPNQLHPISQPIVYLLSGPPGRPTAVCGLDFYRDDLLGAEYSNNAFVCEPVNNLVHRRILSPHGATFRGARAADEADVEFCASTDTWFRPVQVRTGLDGCLYVVDMHRALIEHPKWVPEESLRDIDQFGGRAEGRIYRVRRADAPARPVLPMDHLNLRGLVGAMDSPNGPQRDLAQQLLVTRRAAESVASLRKLVHSSQHAATRVQALCTLDGLAALDAEVLTTALDDADASVRRHAVRLSEPLLAASPALLERVLQLAADADAQVQLQVAYSLGEIDDARAAKALAQLAWEHPADPYVLAGVWSSVDAANAGTVVRQIFALAGDSVIADAVLDPAIRLVLQLGSPADIEAVATAISAGAEREASGSRLAAAARLLEQSGGRSRDAATHSSAVETELAPMIASAQRILESDDASEGEQLAAVRFLKASDADPTRVVELATRLIAPQCSPAVQQSAAELIASCDTPDAGATLLDAWTGFTPATRAVAFDAIMGRPALVAQLVNRLTAGSLRSADLDALQRQRLTSQADATLRDQAIAALAGTPQSDRKAVVAEFLSQPADGEAARGRQIFDKHCASCHRLEGRGHEVGPDLAALTTRTRPALAESILDPNRAVDERFQSYTALTVDGQSHAGVVLDETSTSVTLVAQEGKTRTLLRGDLELLQNSGLSLMPEGFERDLSARDIDDVIAYLAAMGPARKIIEGASPTVITADYNGALWLLPSEAEVFGNEITFEPQFANIGFWHAPTDHVAWTVQAPQDQTYDVFIRWACSEASAGNMLAVGSGHEAVQWEVAATGPTYDRYRTKKIGRLALVAGENRVVVRPAAPMTKRNLVDLGGVYLLPAGTLLDGSTPEPPPGGHDAATGVAKLLDGLQVGTPAEYERIPAIWELAIDAGRRNIAHELRRLLDLALPKADESLADWQAVVVGGGVVNGVSQAGAWPRRRMAEVIGDDAALAARWTRSLELAKAMADNESVNSGTRYDALRIVGADDFEKFGAQLVGYLTGDGGYDLQMGAVSGLADMETPRATEALIGQFAKLEGENRDLAFRGLLRTPERAKAFSAAVAREGIASDVLSAEELGELRAAVGEGD